MLANLAGLLTLYPQSSSLPLGSVSCSDLETAYLYGAQPCCDSPEGVLKPLAQRERIEVWFKHQNRNDEKWLEPPASTDVDSGALVWDQSHTSDANARLTLGLDAVERFFQDYIGSTAHSYFVPSTPTIFLYLNATTSLSSVFSSPQKEEEYVPLIQYQVRF